MKTHRLPNRRTVLASLVAASALVSPLAFAQDFPAKPLRIAFDPRVDGDGQSGRGRSPTSRGE